MKSAFKLVLATLALAPATSMAQEQAPREGFGISFGPALVASNIHCKSCGDKTFPGAGGYLRLGHYLRPTLFVGAELNLHTLATDYNQWNTNSLSGILVWYPTEMRGFHLKSNLGVARLVDIDKQYDGSAKTTLTAPAIGIGLGYDIRTRHRFLLTPFARATFLTRSDYKQNGHSSSSATGSVFQIGVGFTWY